MENDKKMSRRGFLKTSVSAGALAGAASLLGGGFIASCTTREQFDTIITNGIVYCGDGKAPIKGDIGIKEGKIAAIGKIGKSCDKLIDAKGLAVSPGFIDIHTHTDTNLLQAPLGDSRIYQGVTTDIGGNCGDSPFPYSDAYYESRKGDMRYGFPFWQDIDGFYNALREKKIGINYKSYTGQGQLRSAVVGDKNVKATKEDIAKMCAILDKELEMGSLGLSCGLEYAPGSYASDEEIIELCKVVAKHNGLFAIHMRNEDDHVEEAIKEALDIARKSGARLEISHLKAQNEPNWHKGPNMIKLIEDARSSGVDVTFDRYPYIAFSTGLTTFIPLELRDGSNADILKRLNNKATSDKIGAYAESRVKRLGGAQNVLIAACFNPENSAYSGKNIAQCCEISGMEVWPMIRHLLISENLGVQMSCFAMTEDNVRMFLSHKLGMPASDGSVYSPQGPLSTEIPHPRSYGTFQRFFGKYVREDKICDLATGIYKCTALPASRIGLKDRGLIAVNYAADIVVFNPDTIIDTADYSNPHQLGKGIEHVIVNGQHTIENGVYNGCELKGCVL